MRSILLWNQEDFCPLEIKRQKRGKDSESHVEDHCEKTVLISFEISVVQQRVHAYMCMRMLITMTILLLYMIKRALRGIACFRIEHKIWTRSKEDKRRPSRLRFSSEDEVVVTVVIIAVVLVARLSDGDVMWSLSGHIGCVLDGVAARDLHQFGQRIVDITAFSSRRHCSHAYSSNWLSKRPGGFFDSATDLGARASPMAPSWDVLVVAITAPWARWIPTTRARGWIRLWVTWTQVTLRSSALCQDNGEQWKLASILCYSVDLKREDAATAFQDHSFWSFFFRFFFTCAFSSQNSMVEIWGQNSNRKTVKQTVPEKKRS